MRVGIEREVNRPISRGDSHRGHVVRVTRGEDVIRKTDQTPIPVRQFASSQNDMPILVIVGHILPAIEGREGILLPEGAAVDVVAELRLRTAGKGQAGRVDDHQVNQIGVRGDRRGSSKQAEAGTEQQAHRSGRHERQNLLGHLYEGFLRRCRVWLASPRQDRNNSSHHQIHRSSETSLSRRRERGNRLRGISKNGRRTKGTFSKGSRADYWRNAPTGRH
jgi:hypothetical protein